MCVVWLIAFIRHIAEGVNHLIPYRITFVPALILQQSRGTTPIKGDRFRLSKNIAQTHMIAYGVHANVQTIMSSTTIFVKADSSFA